MAQDWNRIIQTIRDAERGNPGPEIIVQPGGNVALVEDGRKSRDLSTVPRAVMSASFEEDIARLDPNGLERWRYVRDRELPGWVFEMVAPTGRTFVFLAHHVPALGGWVVTPIQPKVDEQFGHKAHLVQIRLPGGTPIPVICAAEDRYGHRGVRELRGSAAKWMIYTDLRAHSAPFSA